MPNFIKAKQLEQLERLRNSIFCLRKLNEFFRLIYVFVQLFHEVSGIQIDDKGLFLFVQ